MSTHLIFNEALMEYSGYLYLMMTGIALAFVGFTNARRKGDKKGDGIDWQEEKLKVVSWLVYLLLAAAVASAVWSEV